MYIYIIYICIYVCVCVLDTCELISNDYADYGLADYGDCWLRDVCRPEKSKTKSLTGLEAVSIRCVCRPTGSKPSSKLAIANYPPFHPNLHPTK